MNAIALQRSVSDIITEYEAKAEALLDEVAAFHSAARWLEIAACVCCNSRARAKRKIGR